MTTEKTINSVPSHDQVDGDASDAWIVLIYGGDLGRRYQISGETTVGRGETNTVVVDMSNVSRDHARFFKDDTIFFVEDLDSTNGTFVNDAEIHDRGELTNGDLIAIGGAVFKFIVGGNVEALYHEEIYRLTILDGLTGVHNKRFLLDFLDREIARANRHDRPLALALIDLDHFKVLNDTHGHLAGDTVLKGVARMMAEGVRREELLARYGGEEFALVLPEVDLEKALVFCERVRNEIENHTFTFDEKDMGVTVSIGVACLEADASADDLIRAADTRLYEAKEAGRNRVCSGS